MNKLNVAKILKDTEKFVVKHSPEFLTGLGIAGMITTTVLAVRATPKALRVLDEKKKEEKKKELTVVDTVKATWKCYIPAVVTGAAAVCCLVGSTTVSLRRNAALVTAYKLSETALTEYKEKVVETIGEKKERTVQEKVYQEQIDKNPVDLDDVIHTGNGNTLCMDPLTKRYFYSSMEHIRKAENIINKRIIHDIGGSVTLNEFYDELGLDRVDIGYNLVWTTDNMIELDIHPGLYKDTTPCLVVGHYNPPTWEP